MRLITFITTILLITTSAFADDTNEAAMKELYSFNDQFNKFVAEKDMEGFLSLYSDKVLWIAPATPPVEGHGEPRATLQFLIDKDGKITHSVDRLFVSNDGSQAVMIGTNVALVNQADIDGTGTYLFVLEREGENWKIVTDMWHPHAEK